MRPARPKTFWVVFLAAIIALGVTSRLVHTGWPLFDKYLGDALYAAMSYVLIRLISPASPWRIAVLAMAAMIAIEAFQLTMIPARLIASDRLPVRLLARLLGTQFAFGDLLAYSAGIGGLYFYDRFAKPPKFHQT